MRTVTRAWAAGVALVVAGSLALTACGASDARIHRVAGASAGPVPAQSAAPVALVITPATKATKLPISTEIGTKVANGTVTAVALTDRAGKKVSGQMREDGSAWVPSNPLRYDTTYTASVTATGADGQVQTRSTTFSTMGEPGALVATGLYLFDGNTYGVGMPVVVEFDHDIPDKARAAVQRRLFVSSNPPQPGVWHWFGARQVLYRPPSYWQPGTKLTVRIALDGQPMGSNRYGDMDRRASVTIGSKVTLTVDNATKKMSVYQDDKLVKTMPVSLGKPGTPSSSGTMVIMDKQAQTVFDTFAELGPRDGYRVNINDAQRLTWGGEFIHAAGWSVADQGRRNVSHGCVNVSPANAGWLFGRTKIGDPVTVTGTERQLVAGNGWTVWNMTWAEYVKGSALPVPPELVAAATTAPGATN